jgi:hypothetical protein
MSDQAAPAAPAAIPSPAPAAAPAATQEPKQTVPPSPSGSRQPDRPSNPLAEAVAKSRQKAATPATPAPAKGKADPVTTVDTTKPKPQEQTKPGDEEKPSDDGDLRSQLRKQTAPPPAAEPDATPEPAADATEGAESELSDADLGVQPNDSKRVRARIQHFEKKAKQYEAELKAEREKAQMFEKQLQEIQQNGAVPEGYDKTLEELARLRRLKDISADPDYQAFGKRIETNQSIVGEALKSIDVPQWVADEIKKAGGLFEFSRVKTEYSIRDDGSGKTKITPGELYERLLQNMAPVDRDAVRGAAAEIAKASRERDMWAAEQGKTAKEYYDNLAKQEETARAAQENFIKTIGSESNNIVEHLAKANDWMQDVASDKPNAVAENKFRGDLRKLVKQTVTSPVFAYALQAVLTDPETLALAEKNPKAAEQRRDSAIRELSDIVVDSARSYAVTRERDSLKAEVAKLQADLKKARGAASTIPTPGSGTTAPSSAPIAKEGKAPPREQGEGNLAYGVRLRREGFTEDQIREAQLA